METRQIQNSPVVRTALLCGGTAGLLCVLWLVGLFLTQNNPYGPKRLLSAFFPPIAAVLSQMLLRRHYPLQGPGLLKSVGVGLLTTGLAAAVAGAGLYLFARVTGPDLIAQNLVELETLLAAVKSEYLKQPNGLAQFEYTRRSLASTAPALAADEFQKKLVLGMLLSIPGGVFFRK